MSTEPKPFDETAGLSSVEIVENLVLPVMQDVDELIKIARPRGLDLLSPELEAGLGGGSIRAVVEDRRQQGAQHIGTGQGGGLLEYSKTNLF